MTVAADTCARGRAVRRWMYRWSIIAISAATACTGPALGSADTAVPDTAWRVHNFTDEILTAGKIGKADDRHPMSIIYLHDLEPGQSRESLYERGNFLDSNFTMAYEVCYRHLMWNLDPVVTPTQKWRDVFVFYDAATATVFLTPQGGGDDINLSRSDKNC